MKKFIYSSNKEKLVKEAEKYGISTEGTLEEIRKRFSKFVDKNIEVFQKLQENRTGISEIKLDPQQWKPQQAGKRRKVNKNQIQKTVNTRLDQQWKNTKRTH